MSSRIGRIVVVAALLGIGLSWFLTLKIQRDKSRLAAAYETAKVAVTGLEQERVRLSQELEQAQNEVSGQTTELTALRGELDNLHAQLRDTEQEIGRLHAEQTMVLQGHASMAQQFGVLTEENQRLQQKLSSIKELNVAIRTVKHKLREERWAAWLAKVEARRAEDAKRLANGNRGYVIRNGTSTLASSSTRGTKLQVRVLDPQTE